MCSTNIDGLLYLPWYIILYYNILYYIILYYIILYYIILYYIILYYIKPIHPVLDVLLLVLYLLSFNDFLVRRPVKSWSRWGAVWIFLCV